MSLPEDFEKDFDRMAEMMNYQAMGPVEINPLALQMTTAWMSNGAKTNTPDSSKEAFMLEFLNTYHAFDSSLRKNIRNYHDSAAGKTDDYHMSR